MTKRDLQRWVSRAYGGSLPGTTVATVAAGSPHGWEMAIKWIDAKKPTTAAAGWATLSCLVALKEDAELDLEALKRLLKRVEESIHEASDAARYSINQFVISLGCFVKPLTAAAMKTGERIGTVTANLGNNACQIPYAPDYIRKVEKRGTIGKKRKTVKC